MLVCGHLYLQLRALAFTQKKDLSQLHMLLHEKLFS